MTRAQTVYVTCAALSCGNLIIVAETTNQNRFGPSLIRWICNTDSPAIREGFVDKASTVREIAEDLGYRKRGSKEVRFSDTPR